MPARVPTALLVTAALAFGLAACGDDDNTSTATDATTSTSAAPSGTGSTTSAPAAGATVATRDTSLGEVLVNGEGLTLYAFDNDKDGTPTCIGGCANAWPALLVTGEITAGDGLDASLFAKVANPDGGEQLAVDSRPLYLYSGDAAPGDVNGQGVGNVWHAVDADGNVVTGSDNGGSEY